jgi:hypothetical protein
VYIFPSIGSSDSCRPKPKVGAARVFLNGVVMRSDVVMKYYDTADYLKFLALDCSGHPGQQQGRRFPLRRSLNRGVFCACFCFLTIVTNKSIRCVQWCEIIPFGWESGLDVSIF